MHIRACVDGKGSHPAQPGCLLKAFSNTLGELSWGACSNVAVHEPRVSGARDMLAGQCRRREAAPCPLWSRSGQHRSSGDFGTGCPAPGAPVGAEPLCPNRPSPLSHCCQPAETPSTVKFCCHMCDPAAAAGLTGMVLSQPCSLFPASACVAAPLPWEQGPLSPRSCYPGLVRKEGADGTGAVSSVHLPLVSLRTRKPLGRVVYSADGRLPEKKKTLLVKKKIK